MRDAAAFAALLFGFPILLSGMYIGLRAVRGLLFGRSVPASPRNEPRVALSALVETRLPRADEPKPGRWTQEGSGKRWVGEWRWFTVHGTARCFWQGGEPWAAEDALLPDDSRGEAAIAYYGRSRGYRWRRSLVQGDPAGGWITGSIAIGDDDVVFTDDAEQHFPDAPSAWNYPDLECDLWNDRVFKAMMTDLSSAMAMANGLGNNFWRHRSGAMWRVSLRDAGGIVADLRARGESYVDFYAGDFSNLHPDAWSDLLLELERLGWTRPDADLYDAEAAHVRDMIEDHEQREAGVFPEWYRVTLHPRNLIATDPFGHILEKIHHLTVDGRVSLTERRALLDFLHGMSTAW